MFAALGRAVYRRRKLIVVLWSLIFTAGLVASLSVAAQLKGGGFTDPSSPSQQGQRQMQERLGFGPASLTIVFTSDELSARSPAFQAQVKQALSGIEDAGLHGFTGVRTAQTTGDASFIARDGTATFAVLEFDGTSEQVQAQIPALRSALRPTALTTYLTGDPAVYAELEQRSSDDLRKAEGYTIPVAILVLVLIFGTQVAAALPVIGGGMAVTVTLGLFWLLAQVLDVSVFAMNVATLLGLAVGIDYALFMVGRFREELAAGRTVAEAVETTVATAGRSIFFSGLTVVVGLLGLMIIPYMSMRSMGLGGALVVLVSVLAALTLLPALLGMLGPRVDSLRVIGRKGGDELFWRRWSDWVMRHPVPVLIGTIAIVVVFAWPVLRIESDIPGATALPRRLGVAAAATTCSCERFDAAALSPIEVLVTWEGQRDPFAPANFARLYAYGQATRGDSRRGPGHEHRHLAGHGIGRRRGRVLEGSRRSHVRDPARAGAEDERVRAARPHPGDARRRAGQGRAEARRRDHGAGHDPLQGRARGAADLRAGPGAGRRRPASRRPAGHDDLRRRRLAHRPRLRRTPSTAGSPGSSPSWSASPASSSSSCCAASCSP